MSLAPIKSSSRNMSILSRWLPDTPPLLSQRPGAVDRVSAGPPLKSFFSIKEEKLQCELLLLALVKPQLLLHGVGHVQHLCTGHS